MSELISLGDIFNLLDASVFYQHIHQWSERHLDVGATSAQSEKTNISHLSFPDCHNRNVATIAHCKVISFTLSSCFD